MSAAINSDEQETNARIERQVRERQEFGAWRHQWVSYRQCDTAWLREMAFEAWKAARKVER